jgi:hypothetical protein
MVGEAHEQRRRPFLPSIRPSPSAPAAWQSHGEPTSAIRPLCTLGKARCNVMKKRSITAHPNPDTDPAPKIVCRHTIGLTRQPRLQARSRPGNEFDPV